MNRIFTLFLVFIYIMACNTVKSDGNNTQNLRRVWMLVEFNSFDKVYLTKKGAFLDLTQDQNASSKMGCNQMSFPYQVKNDTEISFSAGMATKMYCEDMKLEDAFSKTITSIKRYSIEGHKLTLKADDGSTMLFVAQDWD